ncbi:MAG: hypothetical protein RI573_13120, partial [Balneolaceae bacterium]|nr:hypothetical protein [Balneolaceae bacterium]
MKKLILFITIAVCLPLSSSGQFLSEEERESINTLSAQDHQVMMEKLGISEVRPGPSGDPNAPNAANSDESKVKDYTLPTLLQFENGIKVESPSDWQERKDEIFELFDREMYGRIPENVPQVTWEVISVKDTLEGDIPVKLKELVGRVDNSTYPEIDVNIDFTLVTPADASTSVPVIIEFGWNLPPGFRFPNSGDGPTWKEQLIEKGWGYGILVPTSYQADHGAGLREGIIGLTNKGQHRKPDDWGTLRAWAWGASRAIDYLETDEDADAERVGIEGLSRYGKAAIVAMAYEPRISIGFIGSSGAGGTKILRRNFGEQVENLASSAEYHWFSGNFIKYAGPKSVHDLPVDAHMLVALCAPRPVFISSGAPDVEGT